MKGAKTFNARSCSDRRADQICVALILVVSSVLILSNLGNIYLWQDEAQTALVSKTILTHGIPLGTDGKNFFSQTLGAEYTKDFVWIWHPWFPFYLLAGFFAAFGVSTFTARLPFALMGIGTVMLVYYYGKSLWGTRRAGLLAALVLLLNVPFLLLVRQCRYYSPSIFFSLAGLYAYSEMLKGRRYAPTAFGVSAFLLFHTHYVYCAALLATTVVHSLIFRRDRAKAVVIVSAVVTAVCVPWIVLFSGMAQSLEGFGSLSSHFTTNCSSFAIQTVKWIFPPMMILLAAWVSIRAWRRRRRAPVMRSETARSLALLILFAAITFGAVCVTGESHFFRYLGPLIPVFCLISALLLESGIRTHWAVAVIILALAGWWLRMPDYVYEITHDYDGPVEGTVKYLLANGRDTDVVAVTHEDLPLKFYTKMRVIGMLTGEDLSQSPDADWVVCRKPESGTEFARVTDLFMRMDRMKYQETYLDYPDIRFENREDPESHLFRTDAESEPVKVYRRTVR